MEKPRISSRIPSTTRILLFSFLISFSVLLSGLALQWWVYDDWLHQTGPIRIVGTALASIVAFLFVFRWQSSVRERQMDTVRRFQTIGRMNDRIRNELQAIEFATFVSKPDAMEPVRNAVDVIDGVLREALEKTPPSVLGDAPKKRTATASDTAHQRKSA